MDGRTDRASAAQRRRFWLTLAGLIGLSAAVQVVMICRASVPAPDAVHFVELAQQMDRLGVGPVLRSQREPAMFAAWVWVVHGAIRWASGGFAAAWAVSAQVAAAVPLVLAAVPVYGISCRLFGRMAGLAGAMLFCVLPEVCRLGALGIGDSTHLLFFGLALWAMLRYWRAEGLPASPVPLEAVASGQPGAAQRAVADGAACDRGSPWWLVLAGVAAGAALTVRCEILVLVAAVGVSLVGFQWWRRWRHPPKGLLVASVAFLVGFVAIYVPYLAVLRSLHPVQATARAMGRYGGASEDPPGRPARQANRWRLPDGGPMSFDPKDPTRSIRRRGWLSAAQVFGMKLADLFGYGIGLFALGAVWRLRRQLVRPGDRFCHIYLALYTAAVLIHTAREGYLEARHLLPWLVIGVGAAGWGLLAFGGWAARGLAGWTARRAGRMIVPAPAVNRWGGWAAVLLAGFACLADLAWPLNACFTGHRQAARWLAAQSELPGAVLDTRGWTGLYSGRRTVRYSHGESILASSDLAFVVLEANELKPSSRRARTLRTLLAAAAQLTATFPPPGQQTGACRVVEVYRWYPERLARWAAGAGLALPAIRVGQASEVAPY